MQQPDTTLGGSTAGESVLAAPAAQPGPQAQPATGLADEGPASVGTGQNSQPQPPGPAGPLGEPLPQQNKPEKKTPKAPLCGIAVCAVFVAALLAVAFLLAAGLHMRQAIEETRLQNVQNLPQVSLQPLPQNTEALSTTAIIQKVAPSVVSIDVYEEGILQVNGSGSGIIFSEDGYIVTNNHVVEGAFAVRVILQDGTAYTAKTLAQDPINDLAVLKINAKNLIPAEFGDSDQVQVGDTAIAIGNAAGFLPGSPTLGIISGVNRAMQMETSDGLVVTRVLLQTDAAINPGNSGGALVNTYGQVIGINVAKLNSTDIENIGFAIPVKVAMPIIMEMMVEGAPEPRPLIGVSVSELNETNGPANGLPGTGLYIQEIDEQSGLAALGGQVGDVILEADGIEITSLEIFSEILATKKEGDTVSLVLYRPGTEETFTAEPSLYMA